MEVNDGDNLPHPSLQVPFSQQETVRAIFRPMRLSDEPVHLEPYSQSWPRRYEAEYALLLNKLPAVIAELQHIGSTSIPELAAKPTIDMMLGTGVWPWPEQRDGDLKQLGYDFYKTPEEHWRIYVKPWRDSLRGYHLHVVEYGSEHWRRHLLFRDFLRAHPEEAHRYELLKSELAKSHSRNRAEYQEGKVQLIEELMNQAREWLASRPDASTWAQADSP